MVGWFRRKKREEPEQTEPSVPDFLASLEMRVGQLERRFDEWEKTGAMVPAPPPRPRAVRPKPPKARPRRAKPKVKPKRVKPRVKAKPRAKPRMARPRRAEIPAPPAREEEKPVEVTRVKVKKRFKD